MSIDHLSATTRRPRRPKATTSSDATSPVCVLPGCPTTVTAWGDPCTDCLTLFGDQLRPTSAAPLTREMIAARDSYVERAYAVQRQLRPNLSGSSR